MEAQSRRQSEAEFARACISLAGGESSNARVHSGQHPTIIDRGEAGRIWDIDGNMYVDLLLAYGPLILGHRHPSVVAAIEAQIRTKGAIFGMPHRLSPRVAERIVSMVPGIELLRFANSGNEAIITAMRLGRFLSGRPGVVKFEGHFHGWGDSVFADHRPGLEEGHFPIRPRSGGMQAGFLQDLFHAPWNDIEALRQILDDSDLRIGVVMMEPVMANTGVIPPRPGYLQAVREECTKRGVVLIFDEVITGFRLAPGGAQEYFGVLPDITVLGKIVGGGLPLAVIGGSRDVMKPIADGRVFHGGTYSGNPLSLSAADATLTILQEQADTIYPDLFATTASLGKSVRESAAATGVPVQVHVVGPMLQIFICRDGEQFNQIVDYRTAIKAALPKRFLDLHYRLQNLGVYIHPDQFERILVCTEHTQGDLDTAANAINQAFKDMVAENGSTT